MSRGTTTLIKRIAGLFSKNTLLNTKNIDQVYVLNLEHRKDRKKALIKELDRVKTDGDQTLTDFVTWQKAFWGDDVDDWDKSLVLKDYDFDWQYTIEPDPAFSDNINHYRKQILSCSKSEIAISLGHIAMWDKFIESKGKAALFLEDDITFEAGFSKTFNSVFKELPEDWDMVYFSILPATVGYIAEKYSVNLEKLKNGVWWFSGYLLSDRGVRKLRKKTPVKGPIDVWINHQFKDLNVFTTTYNAIEQHNDRDSDNVYSWMDRFWYDDETNDQNSV